MPTASQPVQSAFRVQDLSQEVVVAPLVVGGAYGDEFPCAPGDPCVIGPLAPGPYKLQFPDLSVRKSRFDASVAVGKRSSLHFVLGGEKIVRLQSQQHTPLPAAPAR